MIVKKLCPSGREAQNLEKNAIFCRGEASSFHALRPRLPGLPSDILWTTLDCRHSLSPPEMLARNSRAATAPGPSSLISCSRAKTAGSEKDFCSPS